MAFSRLFVKRFLMALLLIVLVTFSVSVLKVSADEVKCVGECDAANHDCTASCIEKGFSQGDCVSAGFKILCCCGLRCR
ncbi:hypothetical protein H6P81_013132 [Aristolochia fimbriata]|uniref:Defensin-like protein n=1 Tax=Aristolochia fimbriata TaxID=158543 RepID=A0AAV7EE69_ARIFI|nr:hypothetical protein H6P81_013132 [Aristolochia fimbriata]